MYKVNFYELESHDDQIGRRDHSTFSTKREALTAWRAAIEEAPESEHTLFWISVEADTPKAAIMKVASRVKYASEIDTVADYNPQGPNRLDPKAKYAAVARWDQDGEWAGFKYVDLEE